MPSAAVASGVAARGGQPLSAGRSAQRSHGADACGAAAGASDRPAPAQRPHRCAPRALGAGAIGC